MTINDRISELMKYSGLSPAEFSEKIDVQRSSISHILSGRNKPSLDFIIKIKNSFPLVQWDWMINGVGKMIADEKEATKNSETLFSLFDEEEKNYDFPLKSLKPRESDKITEASTPSRINDSQPLATDPAPASTLLSEDQDRRVKKIVFFYNDGKFEVFEP